jgi:polysaccharide biosynthesis/export protein
MIPTAWHDANDLLNVYMGQLWPACWQGGLLALVIWGTLCLMPSMPARWQCWFWRLAMLKFIVVLLLPWFLPLPLLPAPEVQTQIELPRPSARTTTAPPAARAEFPVEKTTELPRLSVVLGITWLVGMACSFFRLGLAWNAVHRMINQSRPIRSGPIADQLRIQMRLFGLRTVPALLEVPGIGSPMLCGIFRPRIVIPAKTRRQLNPEEQFLVLGHELAHIKRSDLFWSVFASIVRCVFFFHPLVWPCERRQKLAQEFAADELAISIQHHDPIGYGNLLVSVVGKLGSAIGSRPLISGMFLETAGPVRSLKRRLVAMSRIGRMSRRVLICSSLLFGAVILLGIIPWRLIAAEAKTKPGQNYCAKISVHEQTPGGPLKQTCAPSLVYSAGNWAFAGMHSDRDGYLMVIVNTSREGSTAEHAMQVFAAREPSGKEWSAAEKERLFQAASKYAGNGGTNQSTSELPKNNVFTLTGKFDANGKTASDGKISIQCDRGGKFTFAASGNDAFSWISPRLMFSSGEGKVTIARNDGSRVEIAVNVSPMDKPIKLDSYRVEPPDVLAIEMLTMVPKPPHKIQKYDVVQIRVSGTIFDQPIDNFYLVEAEGVVNLGPAYGNARVEGMTIDEAQAMVTKQLSKVLSKPKVLMQLARTAGAQPVTGNYMVAVDGTINLRDYGVVHVAGKTVPEIKTAMEKHLAKFFDSPEVSVDVQNYNSKVFYVITSGAEIGDGVRRIPITGNETVLDAVAAMGNVSQLSSKTVWVARPTRGAQDAEQILPVDFEAICQGSSTATNYQILPGDRVFIGDGQTEPEKNTGEGYRFQPPR